MIPGISVKDLASRRENGDDETVVLDVRQPHEREFSSIGGIHIEMSSLPGRLEELEAFRNQEIVVYCRSGQRSANVVRFLHSMGFPGAVNLDGGIIAWSQEVDPTVRQY